MGFETVKVPVINNGLNQSWQDLLKCVSSPENIMIDIIPDSTLRTMADLTKNDGVVIDKGCTNPHTGGDYYLIQHGDLRRIRSVISMPNNTYQVQNDYDSDIVDRNDIQVIGKLIGAVKVRHIS